LNRSVRSLTRWPPVRSDRLIGHVSHFFSFSAFTFSALCFLAFYFSVFSFLLFHFSVFYFSAFSFSLLSFCFSAFFTFQLFLFSLLQFSLTFLVRASTARLPALFETGWTSLGLTSPTAYLKATPHLTCFSHIQAFSFSSHLSSLKPLAFHPFPLGTHLLGDTHCWDHASSLKVLQGETASAKAAYTWCRSYDSSSFGVIAYPKMKDRTDLKMEWPFSP
jgi:hypothetical protein